MNKIISVNTDSKWMIFLMYSIFYIFIKKKLFQKQILFSLFQTTFHSLSHILFIFFFQCILLCQLLIQLLHSNDFSFFFLKNSLNEMCLLWTGNVYIGRTRMQYKPVTAHSGFTLNCKTRQKNAKPEPVYGSNNRISGQSPLKRSASPLFPSSVDHSVKSVYCLFSTFLRETEPLIC